MNNNIAGNLQIVNGSALWSGASGRLLRGVGISKLFQIFHLTKIPYYMFKKKGFRFVGSANFIVIRSQSILWFCGSSRRRTQRPTYSRVNWRESHYIDCQTFSMNRKFYIPNIRQWVRKSKFDYLSKWNEKIKSKQNLSFNKGARESPPLHLPISTLLLLLEDNHYVKKISFHLENIKNNKINGEFELRTPF